MVWAGGCWLWETLGAQVWGDSESHAWARLNAHLALPLLLLLVSGLPAEFIHPDPGPGFPEGASVGRADP